MKISIGNEVVELSLEEASTTLLRLQNINKFMQDILLYFENNNLYKNLEKANSVGFITNIVTENIERCLYFGKLLTDELSLIETDYEGNFELKINENYLIRGAGFVLRYLGFRSKYCDSVSNTSLYEVSADIYSLWESDFKRKLYLPIYRKH
jgi:hypothetical protein